jgi:hypothetical protein
MTPLINPLSGRKHIEGRKRRQDKILNETEE